jgi:hypothetical protein
MRFVLALAVLASLIIPVSAKDHRWTLAYAQGTTEAIIRNDQGSNINIYCPSGQAEPTPGIFFEVKTIKPKAGEAVAVQFVVDGKSHAFDFAEIQFEAKGPARVNALSALIDALTKSKGKEFIVEFPKLGKSERFSLLGAKKAMTSAKEFLDGCAE